MQSIIDFFGNNPTGVAVLGIFGAFGTLLGIVSFVFQFVTRRKTMMYDVTEGVSIPVNEIAYPGLKVTYNGKTVRSLGFSYICIWNTGKNVISGEDIYQENPVTVCFPGTCEILEMILYAKTDAVSEFAISKKYSNKACISFNSMEAKEGAVFKIIHTGAKRNQIFITGRIKDKGKIVRLGEGALTLPAAITLITLIILAVASLISAFSFNGTISEEITLQILAVLFSIFLPVLITASVQTSTNGRDKLLYVRNAQATKLNKEYIKKQESGSHV